MNFVKRQEFFVVVTALIILFAVGYLFRAPIETAVQSVVDSVGTSTPLLGDLGIPTSNEPEPLTPTNSTGEISAPGGLKGNLAPAPGTLTPSGIILETNTQRRENGGLAALTFNAQLAAAAQVKVNDMIENDYFEHVSPVTGKDSGDLVHDAGYQYLAVGENLALGNYDGDAGVVQAWMDSPGHRANILNTKYTEIGIAVGQGMYEGHLVWFAVQEFGRPTSDCSSPSATLSQQIDDGKALLETTQTTLEKEYDELQSMRPKSGSAYNTKVEEYNTLVKSYNALLAQVKDLIDTYNAQVKTYNACVQNP